MQDCEAESEQIMAMIFRIFLTRMETMATSLPTRLTARVAGISYCVGVSVVLCGVSVSILTYR